MQGVSGVALSGLEGVECFYCHKIGHKKNERWKRKAALVDKSEKENSVKSEKDKSENAKGSGSVKAEQALVAEVAATKPQPCNRLSPYHRMMVL